MNSLFRISCLTAGMAALAAQTATAQFTTVGIYDDPAQANAVDKSAAFDAANSSGVGNNSSLVFELSEFNSFIQNAFNSGNGGVVNFDNGNIVAGGQVDTFTAAFGAKTLSVQNTDDIRTDFSTASRTPISGPGTSPNAGFLAKSDANGDVLSIGGNYNFNFTEIGFDSGEHVRAVAGTILSRNGSSPVGNWLMQVTLDNGDVIAALAGINSTSGNAIDDTFYGAYAPDGRYIVGVSWTNPNGVFSGLDDFAFITSTGNIVIPEPGTYALLLGGLGLLFGLGHFRKNR